MQFDEDRAFENPITFRHRQNDTHPGTHNMTMYFLGKTGNVRFRDTRQNPILDRYTGKQSSMVQTIAYIELARDYFVVLHNGPAAEQHDEPPSSWIIDLQLNAAKTFQVKAFFEPEAKKA